MTQANSIGVIAKRCGETPFRVDYVVRTRKIEPAFRAGNLRIFDEEGVRQIEREIKAIRKKREAVPA